MYQGLIVICDKNYLLYIHYTPNGYIVPMKFRVYFCPRISAFSRRTKMHLNGMLLIGTEFFKILVPFVAASNLLVNNHMEGSGSATKSTFSAFCNTGVSTTVTAIPQGNRHKQ